MYIPPLQSLSNNKTLLVSSSPIGIWLLSPTFPDSDSDSDSGMELKSGMELELEPSTPWDGKGFGEENGMMSLRSGMTWSSVRRNGIRRGGRKKLGVVTPWIGMNGFPKGGRRLLPAAAGESGEDGGGGGGTGTGTFECPSVTGKKGSERIAIEFTCDHDHDHDGMPVGREGEEDSEESCFLAFDVAMTYPVLRECSLVPSLSFFRSWFFHSFVLGSFIYFYHPV